MSISAQQRASALILEEPNYFEETEITLPRICFFFFLNFSEYITRKEKYPCLHNLLLSFHTSSYWPSSWLQTLHTVTE